MRRILVTGAGGPAGINFISSLRIAPEQMFIVGTEPNPPFIHLATTDIKYVIPRATEPDYISKLNEIIHKEKIEFLHAQPDIEVEVVSANREKLDTPVYLPSKKTVAACQDKLESARLWKKHSIPVAEFIEIRVESDIDRAFEELGSPIWIRATHGAGGIGSTPASNRQTATSWINYWKPGKAASKLIAQQHLPSIHFAFHPLWKAGES